MGLCSLCLQQSITRELVFLLMTNLNDRSQITQIRSRCIESHTAFCSYKKQQPCSSPTPPPSHHPSTAPRPRTLVSRQELVTLALQFSSRP